MTYYYTLEYYKPLEGHYVYLEDVLENPDTHKPTYYTTTDYPPDAMRWDTRQDAEKFLDGLPFKSDFHVQGMCVGD